MVLILFGRYKKLKVHDDQSLLEHKQCVNPRCLSSRRVQLMQLDTTCHLFYIPLIPFHSQLMVKCHDCGKLIPHDLHECNGPRIGAAGRRINNNRNKDVLRPVFCTSSSPPMASAVVLNSKHDPASNEESEILMTTNVSKEDESKGLMHQQQQQQQSPATIVAPAVEMKDGFFNSETMPIAVARAAGANDDDVGMNKANEIV